MQTKTSLCEIWSQVLSGCASGKTASFRVDAQTPTLVDHIENCEVCEKASQGIDIRSLPLVFEFLANAAGEVSEEDRDYVEQLIAQLTNEERAVESALTTILLPSLPTSLRAEFNAHMAGVPLLALFSAIEAVGLMVRRVLRGTKLDSILLTSTAELVANQQVLATNKALSVEIHEMAEVSEVLADWLLSWICQAVSFNHRLFLGLHAKSAEEGTVLSLDDRVGVMNLQDWWNPRLFTAAHMQRKSIEVGEQKQFANSRR
jgi:hypothetical protein